MSFPQIAACTFFKIVLMLEILQEREIKWKWLWMVVVGGILLKSKDSGTAGKLMGAALHCIS